VLSVNFYYIIKPKHNSFDELSQLKELTLNFNYKSVAMDTNAFNGLTNLETLTIVAHVQNKEPNKLDLLSFTNFEHLKVVELFGITLTSIRENYCILRLNNWK